YIILLLLVNLHLIHENHTPLVQKIYEKSDVWRGVKKLTASGMRQTCSITNTECSWLGDF
ncbi:hypothetical protein ACXAA3_001638, partial [Salmonella enterica subsp. enterica serovar Alachua]